MKKPAKQRLRETPEQQVKRAIAVLRVGNAQLPDDQLLDEVDRAVTRMQDYGWLVSAETVRELKRRYQDHLDTKQSLPPCQDE